MKRGHKVLKVFSSKLVELAPLSYSQGSSTCSNRLHKFSTSIHWCLLNRFFLRTTRLWDCSLAESFPLTYELDGVMSRVFGTFYLWVGSNQLSHSPFNFFSTSLLNTQVLPVYACVRACACVHARVCVCVCVCMCVCVCVCVYLFEFMLMWKNVFFEFVTRYTEKDYCEWIVWKSFNWNSSNCCFYVMFPLGYKYCLFPSCSLAL